MRRLASERSLFRGLSCPWSHRRAGCKCRLTNRARPEPSNACRPCRCPQYAGRPRQAHVRRCAQPRKTAPQILVKALMPSHYFRSPQHGARFNGGMASISFQHTQRYQRREARRRPPQDGVFRRQKRRDPALEQMHYRSSSYRVIANWDQECSSLT